MEKYLQQPYYNSLKLKTTQFPNNREQINELKCIHMMVNELLPIQLQMNHKNIMSKRSQTHKSTCFVIPLRESSKHTKLIDSDRSESIGCPNRKGYEGLF